MSESRKAKLTEDLARFYAYKHIPFDKPHYRRIEKLPFIPLEAEVDQLIASCSRKVAEILQLIKETGIPVDPKTLKTRFPNVYALGDVASVGTPLAGVFSEGAAKVVAAALIAKVKGDEPPPPYSGKGSCYTEFGEGKVGRA